MVSHYFGVINEGFGLVSTNKMPDEMIRIANQIETLFEKKKGYLNHCEAVTIYNPKYHHLLY